MVYISESGWVQVEIYHLPSSGRELKRWLKEEYMSREACSRCTLGLVVRRDLVDGA